MSTLHPELQAALDQRLEQAIESANYRLTLNNQKQLLKLKLQKSLTYATNGGIFRVNQELISFVGTLLSLGKEEAVLLDIHENPTHIANLKQFLDELISLYYEKTNEFMVDMRALQKARNVKSMIGE